MINVVLEKNHFQNKRFVHFNENQPLSKSMQIHSLVFINQHHRSHYDITMMIHFNVIFDAT